MSTYIAFILLWFLTTVITIDSELNRTHQFNTDKKSDSTTHEPNINDETNALDSLNTWKFDELKEVCTCHSQYLPSSISPIMINSSELASCVELFRKISTVMFKIIISASHNWEWPVYMNHHPLSLGAFKQSLLHRGDPTPLVKFYSKLNQCSNKNEKDAIKQSSINIVIFGGSETRGTSACNSKNRKDCPWSNQLKNLFTSSYPQCEIEVYNLAAKSTDSFIVISLSLSLPNSPLFIHVLVFACIYTD